MRRCIRRSRRREPAPPSSRRDRAEQTHEGGLELRTGTMSRQRSLLEVARYRSQENEEQVTRHVRNTVGEQEALLTCTFSFFDGDETSAERLPATSDALQHVFKTYGISHRFAFFLSKQRMASASTYFEADSTDPSRLGTRQRECGKKASDHASQSTGTQPLFEARQSIHLMALGRS